MATICTFDLNDRKNLGRVCAAQGSAISLATLEIGAKFNVVALMIEDGTKSDGGECKVTYIFTDDGTVYRTQSWGVYLSCKPVAENAKSFIAEGIPATLIEQASANGRTYKKISFEF